jgi:hypothetical protein
VAFNVIGLPAEGRLGNVQLQTRSPTNEVDQCLNWSAKKESFLVRILADFYFFGISEYECDKNYPSLTNF